MRDFDQGCQAGYRAWHAPRGEFDYDQYDLVRAGSAGFGDGYNAGWDRAAADQLHGAKTIPTTDLTEGMFLADGEQQVQAVRVAGDVVIVDTLEAYPDGLRLARGPVSVMVCRHGEPLDCALCRAAAGIDETAVTT